MTSKPGWIPTDILSIPSVDLDELEAMITATTIAAPRPGAARRASGATSHEAASSR
jgi:hypothetical protein